VVQSFQAAHIFWEKPEAMTKTSILRLLEKLAHSPMHRRQLGSDVRANARTIRDEPFPKGLRGLIEEVTTPTGFNSVCKIVWTITSHGRNLLEALKTNPDALPPKGIGISAQERAQRDAEGNAERMKEKMAEDAAKHVRCLKHERRLRNPKHSCRDYDEAPTAHVDTSSSTFRALPSLERIRILRHQCGNSRPGDVASNEWTAEETELLNHSLYPERYSQPQHLQPATPANAQPQQPGPPFGSLVAKQMTPEEEIDHKRRVKEMLDGMHARDKERNEKGDL
jgi:hypothetical protein